MLSTKCNLIYMLKGHNIMEKIVELVTRFREAIEKAKEEGCFVSDIPFCHFPRGCCGDASDLLAHYLLQHGISSNYICGNYYGDDKGFGQSHAWLQLENGIIMDITGDQFKYNDVFLNYSDTVYVGKMDSFHALFEVEERDIKKSVTLDKLRNFCYTRLMYLYNTITEHL